ncbi:MAG: putative quinol monooxygenase [Geminicoccaceae bacterium]
MTDGPVLRIFEVRTKQGCVDKLLQNFATTSADVVRGKPGNKGYFFGRYVQGGENAVLFVSAWKDLDAVKAHFGEDWQSSHLPPGYEELIEACSVRHVDLGAGWHVQDLSS